MHSAGGHKRRGRNNEIRLGLDEFEELQGIQVEVPNGVKTGLHVNVWLNVGIKKVAQMSMQRKKEG